ncbi:MAG TPA: DUF3644 domain-containing protein [Allosphingosinicella sp.]|nr:DUF3644 domain-containing protein [Allosphingosinicella sp.]
MVEKSISAAVAAIEVYNKPDFRYREESFCILMLNAWELLLKARILVENGGDLKSIEIWEKYLTKSGKKSERKRAAKSRSGNIKTVGIERAIGLVKSYAAKSMGERCAQNLTLLIEIRDTAIHFHHDDLGLSARVLDVGMAAIQNYMRSLSDWFDITLEHMNFYLMPLAFQTPAAVVESLSSTARPASVSRLLKHIADQEAAAPAESNDPYTVTMRVTLKFSRSAADDAGIVKIVKGGEGVLAITLTEEDMRERFPWSYEELTHHLRQRYSNFKANQGYHDIRKPLEDDPSFCHERYLNPDNPKGGLKRFYNPNILAKFDEHYEKS